MKLIISDRQAAGEGRQRVQFIGLSVIQQIIPKRKGGMQPTNFNDTERFKDWFNKQFSEPQPVECAKCKGRGKTLEFYQEFVKCDCGCDNGISHYISYVYDNNWDITDIGNDITGQNYNWKWKDKELKIMVNPFCEVFKIAREL